MPRAAFRLALRGVALGGRETGRSSMPEFLRHWLTAIAILLLQGASVPPAAAQGYPSAPLRLIVGYAEGGAGDVLARLMADKLATALGQLVTVENQPGASGAKAAQSVARASPDGYVLLVGQPAEIAVNQHLIKELGYDPEV